MADIILKVIIHGEDIIEVDENEYKQAKEEGTLHRLLDWEISDVETETTVIEPDGTEVYPYD